MNRHSLYVPLFFVALAAIFFAPVLFTDRVLIPFDNLYQFPPWSAFAKQFGVTVPHNALISDLLLENYAWKKFIVESLSSRELPLWNPYLFAGVPFLAAGQHSAMYPFSVLFYILPIARAYGYFVALQFVIAMLGMFWLMRTLGASRWAGIVSGVVYAFSGFFVVSTAFPMVISAAAWLPAILACVEKILRDEKRRLVFSILGSILLGVQFLAGHIEISIYNLIVIGFYAAWRAITIKPAVPLRARGWKVGFIAVMIAIGIALGAVQLAPLYEVVHQNFRVGSVSYETVISYAYLPRQLIAFLVPDFFGNPTHHSYLDVFDFSFRSAPNDPIFWGSKNYVEAGAYVGILPLLLALIAIGSCVVSRLRLAQGRAVPDSDRLKDVTWLFAVLALVSLLFTFGTPLYALLFFGVPGFNQLHTPFRWVYPYMLSMGVLAGIGIDAIGNRLKRNEKIHTKKGSDVLRLAGSDKLAWSVVALGAVILIALSASYLARDAVLPLLDRFLRSTNVASRVFDSGRMFYSYEFRNIVLFAIFLIGAGAVIRLSRCPIYLPKRLGAHPVWKPLAVLLIVVDLFVIGVGFYSVVDPRLADVTPPAIKFLEQDKSLYRITSYDQRGGPEQKTFNPNVGMFYDISDIRGYDSIIPKQYGDLMGLLAPQDELLNNRIAPFYSPDPLDSPLVNLLNVKYVLTTRPLPNAGYTLVYDDEISIYRNERVLPRAFMVPQARVIPNRETLLEEMRQFDPAKQVLLEESPAGEPGPSTCTYNPVSIQKYSGNQVIVESDQSCSGWLVLADSYFPGWIAQIDDVDTHLYKADFNFRAIFVPAGVHTVRFKYSPVSLRIGIIASFLGGMVLVLAGAYLLWRRFYRAESSSQVQVIAKNSLLPMATSLLMKLVTLALAFLSLRILGPTGTGRYALAVTIWFFADTVTDFGLGILLTREVSRDRLKGNAFLFNSAILRTILWTATLLPIAAIVASGMIFFNLTLDTAIALALLVLGILPATLAASFAFLFNAYERFEYRIVVDFAMRLVNVALSAAALVMGYGVIGLAAVSVVTNAITLAAFYLLVRRALFKPHLEMDRGLIRWMFFESYPLMINNLLSSLFFRIDTLILWPLKGDTVLGYYNTAYKFIDALNFIPSNFTLAIFPALARLATSAKDAMLRAYILSLKILLWIALPITVGTIFVAHDLVQIFGGDAYLPHSAIALQVLIWFLPFSFINSVTHYVLIALNQQRYLTKAFIIGVLFNVVANLLVIPPLSYTGASLVTVLSEIALLIPFYLSVRRNLATIPFLSIAWRPAVAASAMGAALWWLTERIGLFLAIPVAGGLYCVLLIVLGAFGEDERVLLRRLVPQRFRGSQKHIPKLD